MLIGRLAEQLAMILSELLIPCPGHRCRRMISHNAEIVHRDLRLKPGNAVVDVEASRNRRHHPASTEAVPFFFQTVRRVDVGFPIWAGRGGLEFEVRGFEVGQGGQVCVHRLRRKPSMWHTQKRETDKVSQKLWYCGKWNAAQPE